MACYHADRIEPDQEERDSLLIANCTIITLDRDRRVLKDGCVVVKGSTIAYVGTLTDCPFPKDSFQEDRIINGRGNVLIPGLIDSHAHAGHGLTKTLGEGGAGMRDSWDSMMERLYFQGTTPEFWKAEAYLSGLEKIQAGITTGLSMFGSYPRFDDPESWDAHVEAMAEVGIRDILGVGPPNPPYPKTFRIWKNNTTYKEYSLTHKEALSKTEEAVKRYRSCYNGRILCYPTPSGVGKREGLSLEEHIFQHKEVFRLSEEYGVPIHGHSYGGDILFAQQHFPFLLGPNLSLAHCTGISSEEVNILAQKNVSVCSGPCTTAYILNRCPVIELLNAGCNVTFCSDASAPDRTYDLFEKMRVGIRLQRVHFKDPELLPAGKALEMVTIHAARALGLEDQIGSIEVGKKADLVLIDVQKPHLYPLWQEPLRVVYQAYPSDVDTVLVDGKMVMRNRKIPHINQEQVLMQSQEEAWKALQRLGFEGMAGLPKNLWRAVHY